MERLYRYFFSADTTDADKRTFGIEVETLFVDEVTHHPIDYRRSQQLMSQLVSGGKWRPRIVDKGSYTELSADGFALKYEVGSNLLEITTPAVTVSHKDMLFSLLGKHLEQLYSAAASVNAVSCESHYDGSTETALVLNSKSSFLDFDLNGDSFAHLAHIAAVHFNIDLESVYQGLQWMRQMTSYFEMRDWPLPESRHCWQMFLAQSPAGYEVERYGKPPDADEYLRTLAGLRVYKNRTLLSHFWRIHHAHFMSANKSISICSLLRCGGGVDCAYDTNVWCLRSEPSLGAATDGFAPILKISDVS